MQKSSHQLSELFLHFLFALDDIKETGQMRNRLWRLQKRDNYNCKTQFLVMYI